MNLLQQLVDQTPEYHTLDIRGWTYNLTETLYINKPITILASGALLSLWEADYDPEKFNPHDSQAAIHINTSGAQINGLQLNGPGRTNDELAGIWITGNGNTLSGCHCNNFQYALYAVSRSNNRLSGCSGYQHFEEPWQGLNYGIMLRHAPSTLVDSCRIRGTRHALVFGNDSDHSVARNCELTNTADVQCVAFKPNTTHCLVDHCSILGGLNIGGGSPTGHGHTIRDCTIVGRSNWPQTATPIWGVRETLRGLKHVFQNCTITGTDALPNPPHGSGPKVNGVILMLSLLDGQVIFQNCTINQPPDVPLFGPHSEEHCLLIDCTINQ